MYKRLTDLEAQALYNYLKMSIDPRDLIIQVMFETGARIGEVFMLGADALLGNVLTIQPLKKSLMRQVTVSDNLKLKLAAVLKLHKESSLLLPFGKITRKSAHKNIARYLDNYVTNYIQEKTGQDLGIKLTPHVLRHTAFSRLYEATKDLMLVQQWAGHGSINSTIKYMQLATRDEANRTMLAILGG